MPRANIKAMIANAKAANEANERREQEQITEGLDGELVPFKPDNIDAETWDLMQENGRLATEKLNKILRSPGFLRMRPGDQVKIIKLAQDRAYGLPSVDRSATSGNKRRAGSTDVTANELRDMLNRAALPEYKATASQDDDDIEDAEEL